MQPGCEKIKANRIYLFKIEPVDYYANQAQKKANTGPTLWTDEMFAQHDFTVTVTAQTCSIIFSPFFAGHKLSTKWVRNIYKIRILQFKCLNNIFAVKVGRVLYGIKKDDYASRMFAVRNSDILAIQPTIFPLI